MSQLFEDLNNLADDHRNQYDDICHFDYVLEINDKGRAAIATLKEQMEVLVQAVSKMTPTRESTGEWRYWYCTCCQRTISDYGRYSDPSWHDPECVYLKAKTITDGYVGGGT